MKKYILMSGMFILVNLLFFINPPKAPAPVLGMIKGMVTNCCGGSPIGGVSITTDGGYSATYFRIGYEF